MLSLTELRELRRPSALRGAGLVLHAWATIALAMVVSTVWPSAFTLLLAIAVIGSRQLGLLVLMHEGAHWLLVPSMRANTLVARWLCAAPLFAADVTAYRRTHHLHHRHTQQPEDPDLALAAPFPVRRRRFWSDVVLDLSGWTLGARIVAWPGWRHPRNGWRQMRGPLLANAVLLSVLALAGHWELYLLLWLLPLATWHQVLLRVRNIAEHAMVPETRTTHAGPLARAFLAPYWMNYHVEHHLLVFVPCWKLGRAHALLRAKGYDAGMELAPGYLDVLSRATAASR